MVDWSESTGNNWNEYFIKINPEKFVYDVRDGKMTPWLIFNSATGRDALGKLDDSLLAVIFDIMNPTYWSSVFSTRPAELEMVREVISDGEL
jgi:hypothetical protein